MSVTSTIDADYVIAGAGCAGLSLAIQLKRSGLPFSKIILIDKERKNKNDRTWCFWTNQNSNWFDPIVLKKWTQFEFRSKEFSQTFQLEPYSYQMIRGIDFYSYCLEEIKKDSRFEIVTEDILHISGTDNEANVTTSTRTYKTNFLFNSVVQSLHTKSNHINYIQHFKGWLVETDESFFDAGLPVFMDFKEQTSQDCRFFYVIPYSSTQALVEYTGFSKDVWEDSVYELALGNYLKKHMGQKKFRITETESGKIPMYESEFINPFGKRIVNIGSAGGSSKPSTGYTFYFIQAHTQQIIKELLENKTPSGFKRKWRFGLYDKILLEVLNKAEISASDVFSDLFKKNKVHTLLAFLNEQSSLKEELKIMSSVQKLPFLKAAFSKIGKI